MIGIQNKSPQDVPLWDVDYVGLKATKTLQAQEQVLPLLNYLEKNLIMGLAHSKR